MKNWHSIELGLLKGGFDLILWKLDAPGKRDAGGGEVVVGVQVKEHPLRGSRRSDGVKNSEGGAGKKSK